MVHSGVIEKPATDRVVDCQREGEEITDFTDSTDEEKKQIGVEARIREARSG